ncbi:hypothetical protein JRO89_XS15G0031300 [Xanthoceras sorbifolium]|uniref:Uncharacterized protein n=1 Tax=Xanthoceras sorbifolium TaxID=99658 RepID=A0ABQ8H0V0_9ROSI|nr:hypothetical protein JRO89_XS15G0031300 [Xanthoceras sorbifolium]
MTNISSSLTSLGLHHCQLQGYLLENIFSLPNLQRISLADNHGLEGAFPHNLSNPLKILDVSFTSFSGQLPDSIGNLKSLIYLNLYDCNFIGSVPRSLSNLTELAFLNVASNNFSGHIPSSISNLEQLSSFSLDYNNFTGEIPDLFVNLTQLSYLDFSNNQLVGPIPSYVSRLRNLVNIHLDGNSLNGTIPSELFSLPLLEYIDLSHNKLKAIENGEFQSDSLQKVDLSNNRLRGSIPNSIFELVNLTYLVLFSNNLSGSMEFYKFAKLKNLENVDLSRNSLSLNTTINSSFQEIVKTPNQLSTLDLSDNKIHGRIPSWMLDMGKDTLYYLNLSHNYLTEIEQLPWKHLGYLDLSHIPSSLGNMTTLESLDLSSNRLVGEIPKQLASLNFLVVLNLSRN